MKTKLGATTAIVVALVVWGLKRYYADARADDLWWMLAPTTWIVEALSGASFSPAPGEGYLSRERLFLIEKSCAGINFMIAAFGMSAFVLCRRTISAAACAGAVVVSLAVAYAAAVIVNATRITIAMWLAAHPPTGVGLTAAQLHRLEGIAVYFGGLVLLYELLPRVDTKASFRRRLVIPLASYYIVALGLPIANGAWRAAGFVPHATVVLLLPAALVTIASVRRS